MPITTVERDIGRRVIYMGDRTLPPPERIGEITSLNEHYVFVRYARDTTSKATRRDDLEWCF